MAKRSSAEPWAAWVAEQREWVHVSAERNATIFQLNPISPSRMAGPAVFPPRKLRILRFSRRPIQRIGWPSVRARYVDPHCCVRSLPAHMPLLRNSDVSAGRFLGLVSEACAWPCLAIHQQRDDFCLSVATRRQVTASDANPRSRGGMNLQSRHATAYVSLRIDESTAKVCGRDSAAAPGY